MAGYASRQETYSDGDTVAAADTNNEFNAIVSAFNNSTGHNHDGTAGEGARILEIGPSANIVTAGAADVVINEGSADIDFRVEGAANTHLLFLDAGAEKVTINTAGDSTVGDGFFTVYAGSAGSVTASVNANEFVIEDDDNSNGIGLTILGPDTQNINIYLGCASDNDFAYITGNFTSKTFTLGTNNSALILHERNNNYGVTLTNSNAAPDGIDIDFSTASPDNNSKAFIKCQDSTTDRLIVYSDGDVVNHDNSYGAISDESTKQDILDASSQWDDIKATKVRRYRSKEDVVVKGVEAPYHIGVVAQEIELVSPGLVITNPDGLKSVQYSILYMKAVKALQETMTRIEDLEARVTALEGK